MVNFLFTKCILVFPDFVPLQTGAQIEFNPVLFSAQKYGDKPSWRGMIAM